MRKSINALLMLLLVFIVLLSGAVVACAKDDAGFDYDDELELEGSAAYDSGDPEVYITLVNNSGWNFTRIWMGPSSNTKWLLRDKFVYGNSGLTLRNGQSVTLRPSSASRHGVRYWDIRVDYGRNRKKEIYNIDLYNVDEIDIGRNFRIDFQR